MARIWNTFNTKCWWGYGATGTLLHCWWECKVVLPLWKRVWQCLTKLKILLPWDPGIMLFSITQMSWKFMLYKNLHMDVFYSSFIHNCQNSEAIKLFFNGWMNKQAVVHSANKVLFRALKKELSTHKKTWRNLHVLLYERSQGAKSYIIYDTNNMTFWEKLWRPKKGFAI